MPGSVRRTEMRGSDGPESGFENYRLEGQKVDRERQIALIGVY